MFTDHTLIIINIACIGFLLVMLLVLAAATRMKSGAGWAALIVIYYAPLPHLIFLNIQKI